MYSVLASGIRAGRYHAALFRSAPDSKRFPTQGRITVLFYGAVKGVQVNMQDFTWHILPLMGECSN
jgi:hypothetical protein